MFEPTMSALQPDEVVRMKLSCRDSAQFLSEFAPKMASRIFVPMEAPLAAGSTITLHIRFQDGEVHVKGKAEVIKAVITPRAGIHVRFSQLDPDSLQFSLTRTSSTQSALIPRVALEELSKSSETYIPPMTPVDAAGAPVPLPGAMPPPKPSSPKPVSSLLSDAPPPRPSSPAFVPFVPKPASPLLDPPPPKPSSPKPVSSLLADAPAPKPSSPAFVPFVPKPSSPSVAKTEPAPPPSPSSPSIAKPVDPAPDPFTYLQPAAAPATKVSPLPPRPSPPLVAKAVEPAPAPKPVAPAAEATTMVSAPPASRPSSPPMAKAVEPAPAPAPAPAPKPAPAPPTVRESRPLDGPVSSPPRPKEKRPSPPKVTAAREDADEPPRSSRLPLMIGLGIVVIGLVGAGLFVTLSGGSPKPTKAAAQSQVVLDLLKKMDEQMMAGRYAGPGGDTALDSLRIALATAPENARVKEYQQKLVAFFERRAEEALAKSDHAEAAVQLIALSLADPTRSGVADRLKAEEDQVKNQAARPAPK